MNALIFPGQGSQIVGMGSEFYSKFSIVRKIFKKADDRLNFPISKIILEGPANELQLTKNTQPAILTVSYSIFKVLEEEFKFSFKDFKFFAGHSLGEYSALVCANSLNFNDAIHLLHERGKAMQEAVPIGKGGMIALLGEDIENIKKIIKETELSKSGVCEIANDNAIGQVIVSGDINSIDSFKLTLKKKNVKFIPLKVSAPFHCSLMEPAAKKMKIEIDKREFKKPIFDIVANVNAKPENDSKKLKELLVKQISSTVKWRESLNYMSASGVKTFIEVGPGKALSGMVKRTIKQANSFSINTINDIENLKNEFK